MVASFQKKFGTNDNANVVVAFGDWNAKGGIKYQRTFIRGIGMRRLLRKAGEL